MQFYDSIALLHEKSSMNFDISTKILGELIEYRHLLVVFVAG